MKRIDALHALAAVTAGEDLFIGSVGPTRDDWWNVRPDRTAGAHNTFSPAILGSVAPTALGLALVLPQRRVIAIDTDGSMLMNLGALCTLGAERPGNLTVAVLDNEIYESSGGQPTHTALGADLARIAEAAGCINCSTVDDPDDLSARAAQLLDDGEFGFVVAKIEPGVHRWPEERRRPFDGIEDKYRFRRHIASVEHHS